MARDYAKTRSSANNKKQRRPRPAAKRKKKQSAGLPGWVWLFCGLCVGLVVAAGIYVFARPAGKPGIQVREITPELVEQQTDTPQTAPQPGEEKEPPEPRYDFYRMLPNYEVAVPTQDPVPTPENPEPEPRYEQPGQYVVQVGSFGEYDRADRLRAIIGLLGIESEIHQAELADGQTVYRVRTKMIEGADALNHMLEKLHAKGIRTLVMRRKD